MFCTVDPFPVWGLVTYVCWRVKSRQVSIAVRQELTAAALFVGRMRRQAAYPSAREEKAGSGVPIAPCSWWWRSQVLFITQPWNPRHRDISEAAFLISSAVSWTESLGNRNTGPETVTATVTGASGKWIGAPTMFSPISSSSMA
jgi:hypothetical protein